MLPVEKKNKEQEERQKKLRWKGQELPVWHKTGSNVSREGDTSLYLRQDKVQAIICLGRWSLAWNGWTTAKHKQSYIVGRTWSFTKHTSNRYSCKYLKYSKILDSPQYFSEISISD